VGSDSTSLLKFLEENPADPDARRALADALADEGRDPVLTFGVCWLVGKGVWVEPAPAGSRMAHQIRVAREVGVEFPPVLGRTVEDTLRKFSANLWELKRFFEALFSFTPFDDKVFPKKGEETPALPAPAADPFDIYREWVRPRRQRPSPWVEEPVRWTDLSPHRSPDDPHYQTGPGGPNRATNAAHRLDCPGHHPNVDRGANG
jgi:hypothetical protein